VYIASWALWHFLLTSPIPISFISLLLFAYGARLCIGAYRFLKDEPFTFSSHKLYPSLYFGAFLFLFSSYLIVTWVPWLLGITIVQGSSISEPFSFSPSVILIVTVVITTLFARQTWKTIK